MDEFDTHFFAVIHVKNGRMYRWDKAFLTREEADACVKEIDGIAIIEWVRDRKPQFSMPWVREDMKNDPKLARFN